MPTPTTILGLQKPTPGDGVKELRECIGDNADIAEAQHLAAARARARAEFAQGTGVASGFPGKLGAIERENTPMSLYSRASSNQNLVVAEAGWYRVTFRVAGALDALTSGSIWIENQIIMSRPSNEFVDTLTAEARLTAGSFFRVYANCPSGFYVSWAGIERVGS